MRKEQLEKALEVAIQGLRELGLDYAHHTARVEAKVDSILHPAPAYEEVPYERWAVVAPSGFVEAMYFEEESANDAAQKEYPDAALVKLSGTLCRALPRPVERSVEITFNNFGEVTGDTATEANVSYAGKTGIFIWEE